jgi:hypothetical protein
MPQAEEVVQPCDFGLHNPIGPRNSTVGFSLPASFDLFRPPERPSAQSLLDVFEYL